MQMKQGPDTFTGVPLSWACVGQQWGYPSEGGARYSSYVFSPESNLEADESPQALLALSHSIDGTDYRQPGLKQENSISRKRTWNTSAAFSDVIVAHCVSFLY